MLVNIIFPVRIFRPQVQCLRFHGPGLREIRVAGYEIQLFPNPVNNTLRINAPYLMKTVRLYNIFGQLLKTADINSEVFELDMNQYTGGLYILTVSTPVKNVTMKIIKN
jgi:hypothetical protein